MSTKTKPKNDNKPMSPGGRTDAPCSAWEYKVEKVFGRPPSVEALNIYGLEGWKMCATVSSLNTEASMTSHFPHFPHVTAYIFKRPLPQPNGQSAGAAD